MGRYDFDTVIDRKGTGCIKYDAQMRRMGRNDLLPLWVADMDFRAPQEVLDVLKARIDHGIFGYTDPDDAYGDSLVSWFQRRYGVTIQKEWNTVTPGVVYALAAAVRAYTKPGDAVIIQQPVYYPFREVIQDNRRRLVNSQLIYEDGRYHIDFDDFERKIYTNSVKLFLLCNPHNPVGRVWTREELQRLGEICKKHGVTVFSDEIHCDFVYPGHTFVPFASVDPSFKEFTVTGTSASKTFNIAGLQCANILIPDQDKRRFFRREVAASGYSQGNVLGMVATKAFYDLGEPWLEELLQYLKGNLDYVRQYVKDNLPGVSLVEPEGTYLLWLDFGGTGLKPEELEDLVVNKARLWLDGGAIFGKETALFERINIACPRSILEEAMGRLGDAVKALQK